MTRGLALASLFAALAVAGWLVTAQLRSTGATSATGITATQAAAGAASTASLAQAALDLESARAIAGTYAGAAVRAAGVAVARADEASYCLQTADMHLAGPGGTASPGPC